MQVSAPSTAPRAVTASIHRPEHHSFRLVDIHSLHARDLDALLKEETGEWLGTLDWDFAGVAATVRSLAESGRLNGVALLGDGETAGYGCVGREEHKGLIVDIYVRSAWRGGDAEAIVFNTLLGALIGTGIPRIEAQFMLLPALRVSPANGCPVRGFERMLMRRDATPLPDRRFPAGKFPIRPWRDEDSTSAAEMLAQAHIGHIDSEIGDQYATPGGANRLLNNLIHFHGGERFCAEASFVALERSTGLVAGLSLASFVAEGGGHIAELCVSPDARGKGLGYELLRQSVAALGTAGAGRVCLTVTAANNEAIGLYARAGFRESRRFFAYVWDPRRPADSANDSAAA